MQQTENSKKIHREINKMVHGGNIQKAIEYCQSALIKDPDDVKLYIRLGDLYMDWHLDVYQAKHYIDEAINQYQMASERLGDNGDIYYKIGFAFYHKGELDRAMNYFDLALQNGADKAQCHFMLAKCLKKKDRYTDSLEETQKALQHCFLASSRIHWLRHRLLRVVFFTSFKTRLQSKWECFLAIITLPFDREGLKSFFKKLKIFSIFPLLLEGWLMFKVKEYDQAIEAYIKAVDKMPGFAPLYCLLGDIYRAVGKYDEAIVEYKMAKWIDTLCLSAYQYLAQAYEELGDYDNAILTYQKFIQIHPNNAILHSNIANLYFMKSDLDSAISHYQSAISLNPRMDWTSSVTQVLGIVQQNMTRNLDAAISSFQASYLLTPKEIDIYINLGSAFYDKQDYENALIIYRRALELEPRNAKIHCNLGYLYWGMGEINEAIREYNLSIKNDPNYDIAYNNLGVIYLDDLAHIKSAIDCFEKAIAANPTYALAHYNLARSLNIKGEKIEAAKYYQMAYDINCITNELDPQEIQDRLNNLFD